ncbi:nucleotidyltransferase domain-containing protein [Sphingobacterium yanglingense]|uniref:Putative nucleotidyltransferase-like protein n=1 Tax=Sphingobacterium yanglingense TaxID=1437280 RepID=A0A4R6WDY9_9SPHI|nr:nucleotidyltransferase family protein [Sphingobacterium yanglingense]TDQ77999.1 putative nucleotidyltransferase-like protein [Sphingobacterium yanglingense]
MANRERIYTVFFNLLRSGLWSRPVEASESFPLSSAEWKDIYDLALAQTVEGLVFSGIERLDMEHLPPTDIWMKWLVRVTKIEQHNKLMNQCLAEQIGVFNDLDVNPILLKGQGIAQQYEAPLRRLAGDIDWYFSTKEDYEKVNNWVIEKDVPVKYMPGRSMCYSYRGLEIDHHSNLIDLYNPFVKPFLSDFIATERVYDRFIKVDGADCRILSPVLNIVQVVSHVLKHLLSFGLGLRQLCDVARLYAVHCNAIQDRGLEQVYKRLGIGKWVVLLHDLLVRYLGLEPRFLPYQEGMAVNADWMMEDILRVGNFGFFDERYSDAETGNRKNAFVRVSKNLLKYGRYAPMESVFFPLVQTYTRVLNK